MSNYNNFATLLADLLQSGQLWKPGSTILCPSLPNIRQPFGQFLSHFLLNLGDFYSNLLVTMFGSQNVPCNASFSVEFLALDIQLTNFKKLQNAKERRKCGTYGRTQKSGCCWSIRKLFDNFRGKILSHYCSERIAVNCHSYFANYHPLCLCLGR